MKRRIKDWLKVMVLLLDEAAAVVLVIVILRWLEIKVPLPVAIVAALIFGAIVFVIHKAIIPTFHKKQVTGSEGLVGLKGEVIESLTPVGAIRVAGECWKAKAVDGEIEAGEEVEIMEVDGLTLKVSLKKDN